MTVHHARVLALAAVLVGISPLGPTDQGGADAQASLRLSCKTPARASRRTTWKRSCGSTLPPRRPPVRFANVSRFSEMTFQDD